MNQQPIDTFQRVEDKYLLNQKQADLFLQLALPYLKPDIYFSYHCHTIYFDNDAAQLISASLSHPSCKMKLRLTTYSEPEDDTPVFLETKKKYGNIVYKKRFMMEDREARNYLFKGIPPHTDNSTSREIDYLIHYYDLKSKVYIGYDRICYVSKNEADGDSHLTAILSIGPGIYLCMKPVMKSRLMKACIFWNARSATAIRCG